MSANCGCGGSSAASSRKAAPAAANGNGNGNGNGKSNGSVGAGPIVRLNPTDGLFLKAEHLDQIQNYARALSLAVGLGTGTGVVYGYGLNISDSTLTATAGLAINPSGHPLQTSEMLRLSVAADDRPPIDPDGFWVVEIEPAEDTTGAENAYGAVCADPCEGVDSIAPWARSLVRLRLRPDVLSGVDAHLGARRNWLASAYFERERRKGLPWLVPGERLPGEPGTVASLASHPWAEPGTEPSGATVPLGVLVRVEGELILDTWTARRELSGPPGERRWDGHLARRPWSIFLAQVLQFQDQLRSESLASTAVHQRVVVDRRAEAVDRYIASIPAPVASWETFKELKASWLGVEAPYEVSASGKTLPEAGFDELPPAGYLGFNVDGVEGRAEVSRVFGDTVKLRFCEVRADYVAGAVQAAQHLDRIPLDLASDPPPQVDILVPTRGADLDGLKTDAYGWVAFVRSSERRCDDQDQQRDRVDLHRSTVSVEATKTSLQAGRLPDETEDLGQIDYVPNRAELPVGVEQPELPEQSLITIFGVAVDDAQKDLMEERAKLLVEAWTTGGKAEALVSSNFSWPLVVISSDFVLPE